jgi:tetratricopeptide (TPR) repeat protein
MWIMKSMRIIWCLGFLLSLASLAYAQDNEKISLANEYFSQGETEKARTLYEELASDERNISFIHSNYFKLLLDLSEFKQAQRYLDKVIKRHPDNVHYQVDQVVLYERQGKDQQAQKHVNELIDEVKDNQYKLQMTAQQLVKNQMTDEAIHAYQTGRKASNDPYAFALQLANLYNLEQNLDMMIEEYLNFLNKNPSHLSYVQNVMQNLLTEQEDMLAFENLMYDKVQQSPNNRNYVELLIWLHLQQKNFYQAFIQARAVDKRWNLGGRRSMEIGQIALENKDYDMAVRIFEYVVENYREHPNYFFAKKLLVNAREEKIKHTYPVDKSAIKALITEYQQLIDESTQNSPAAMEARRNKALLHAFYLDEKDSAITILNEVIHTPGVSRELVAYCKMDMGDIYLLKGEPWESTLLYAQVEKAENDSPLAYEAKLKNAKLNYFKGDFQLAQEHLDVLKLATTREIANDAMKLSMLIKDNTVLDSTDQAMQAYASIELLLFQNKNQEAMQELEKMLQEYPDHSLTDEIYWLQAKIYMESGNFQQALDKLQRIVENYRYDLLSDDAAFLRADIYERQLGEVEKARELYKNFLMDYPGSIYTAESRKRFRKLRGDFVN